MSKDNLGGPKQVTSDQAGPISPTKVVVSPPPPADILEILKTHKNERKTLDNIARSKIRNTKEFESPVEGGGRRRKLTYTLHKRDHSCSSSKPLASG